MNEPMTPEEKLEEISEICDNPEISVRVAYVNILRILDAPSAEPKGEVVTVYLNTLEHYNQCDNSITTVEIEYDDTPETFKQIHRFCPEEGELIKVCMTLTPIREGEDG